MHSYVQSSRLLSGAIDGLVRHGAKENEIDVVRVPGSWELPLAVSEVAKTGKYNAILCLGAVIRGDRLLDTQEEQDRWLMENKKDINLKIRRGIDQLNRGEGIPEDQLDAYLAKLKTQAE